MNRQTKIFLATILAASVSLAGCGGGGGGSTSGGTGGGGTYPSKILRWAAPNSYTDSSPLDPASDLEIFEIYVRTNRNFSTNDSPLAALQAVDPGSGQITTTFDLANLGPFLSENVNYYVSVRAVAKNGLKSAFSASGSFSF